MIQSFVVIQSYGTGNPQLLSAGISEALLTTQFGLALAIPTLFAHAILSQLAERTLETLQHTSLLTLNQLGQEQGEKKPQTKDKKRNQAKSISLVESA